MVERFRRRAIAERGLIAMMPSNSSYYTNSAGQPQDRYEDTS